MTCQLCRGVSTAQRLSLVPAVPVDGTAGIPPSWRWGCECGGQRWEGTNEERCKKQVGGDRGRTLPALGSCSGGGVLPLCNADCTRSLLSSPSWPPPRLHPRDFQGQSAHICRCLSLPKRKGLQACLSRRGHHVWMDYLPGLRDGESFPTRSEGTLSLGLRSLGRTFSLLRKEINVVFSISVTEGLSVFVSC